MNKTWISSALIAFIVGLFVSLTLGSLKTSIPYVEGTNIARLYIGKVEQLTIDGCQYLTFPNNTVHKGNCTNDIHKINLTNLVIILQETYIVTPEEEDEKQFNYHQVRTSGDLRLLRE
jgi:hypothetical protein